jgi:hypothetical protein
VPSLAHDVRGPRGSRPTPTHSCARIQDPAFGATRTGLSLNAFWGTVLCVLAEYGSTSTCAPSAALATADASLAAYTGTEPAFEDAAAEWYRPLYSDTGLALDRVLGVVGGRTRDCWQNAPGRSQRRGSCHTRCGVDGQGLARGSGW